MSSVEQDKNESQRMAYKSGPLIKELFMQVPELFVKNDLIIYPVEKNQQEILKQLDYTCGIDYYVISKSSGAGVSLSWRAIKYKKTQYPNRGVYNAFSLRQKRNNGTPEEKCELYKRKHSIQLGSTSPDYMAQLHYDPLDNDSLLSLAIAKTKDVYEAFDKGLYRECNPNNKNKEVYFFDVFWKKMKENGYKVYDWYRDESCTLTTFLDV